MTSVPPKSRALKRTRARTQSLPDQQFLSHHHHAMPHHHSLPTTPPSPSSSFQTLTLIPDPTSLLSDSLLLLILSLLPSSHLISHSLVCRRWLRLTGRLVTKLSLLQWGFLDSGRVFTRFPNLSDLDIVRACIRSPRSSGILVTPNHDLSLHLDSLFCGPGFVTDTDVLKESVVNQGLAVVANNYRELRRVALVGAGVDGLMSLGDACEMLQEIELHCCNDMALRGVSGFKNLQIVKVIGCVDGFYNAQVTDIGFTILAQGCRRLVKLELCGCEGSYDGIKAIRQCCPMLEELSFSDHRMEGGWLAALQFCGNLKTLRLESCNGVDSSPGPNEYLGCCGTIEELHLRRCQMRDKDGMRALFTVCEGVKEIVLQDCWGLVDEVFAFASIFRRVKLITLEGCSLLTTAGLESVLLCWKDLQALKVVSCNSISDSDITPALATLFSGLKVLTWRPNSKALLYTSLAGTGVGQKGGRFFKRLKS